MDRGCDYKRAMHVSACRCRVIIVMLVSSLLAGRTFQQLGTEVKETYI